MHYFSHLCASQQRISLAPKLRLCVPGNLGCSPGVSGFDAWPTLVPTLYGLLDSPDDSVVDGTLSALDKICEVCARLCLTRHHVVVRL